MPRSRSKPAKVQELIAKEKARYKCQNFTEAEAEEIVLKLKRVNSPMIVFQGWSGSAHAGGAINYNVGIWNPDPSQAIWLFSCLGRKRQRRSGDRQLSAECRHALSASN